MNSASLLFVGNQIIGVGVLFEEKDWGCGREIFWFSRTTAS
jgi:hypothetical protein